MLWLGTLDQDPWSPRIEGGRGLGCERRKQLPEALGTGSWLTRDGDLACCRMGSWLAWGREVARSGQGPGSLGTGSWLGNLSTDSDVRKGDPSDFL